MSTNSPGRYIPPSEHIDPSRNAHPCSGQPLHPRRCFSIHKSVATVLHSRSSTIPAVVVQLSSGGLNRNHSCQSEYGWGCNPRERSGATHVTTNTMHLAIYLTTRYRTVRYRETATTRQLHPHPEKNRNARRCLWEPFKLYTSRG